MNRRAPQWTIPATGNQPLGQTLRRKISSTSLFRTVASTCQMGLLCHAEAAAHFRDNFTCALEIGAFVRGRDDGPQPGLSFGNSGEAHWGGVNTGVIQAAGKFKRLCGLSHMNGSDRRLAGPDGKAKLFHAALEKLRVRP